MVLPNFIIVGAPKCGTTSAFHYLKEHPEVGTPRRKENHFFSPVTQSIIAAPGVARIKTLEDYAGLFEQFAGLKAIGEASPGYLYDPESPNLIKKVLGDDVKLVAFLRNPVRAAYSAWNFNVMHGERLSFGEALAAEKTWLDGRGQHAGGEERNTGPWRGRNIPALYTEAFVYAPQLERYMRAFPQGTFKVFIFEEFFARGLPQYGELCRFLGISDTHRPEEKVHNAARAYRGKWLSRVTTEKMAWKEPLKLLVPKRYRMPIMRRLRGLITKDTKTPEMDEAIRDQLRRKFEPDIRAVERILGKDLSQVWF